MVSDTNNVYSLQYNFMAPFIKETNIEMELLVRWRALFLLCTFTSLLSCSLSAPACGGHCTWFHTKTRCLVFALCTNSKSVETGLRATQSPMLFSRVFFFFQVACPFLNFDSKFKERNVILRLLSKHQTDTVTYFYKQPPCFTSSIIQHVLFQIQK